MIIRMEGAPTLLTLEHSGANVAVDRNRIMFSEVNSTNLVNKWVITMVRRYLRTSKEGR